VLAFVAAFFAAANVVGGYAVTGRMLKMFRRKATPTQSATAGSAVNGGAVNGGAQPPEPARQVADPSEPNHRA
jgi:NAD(P) transhydrogenase subunit alpha